MRSVDCEMSGGAGERSDRTAELVTKSREEACVRACMRGCVHACACVSACACVRACVCVCVCRIKWMDE